MKTGWGIRVATSPLTRMYQAHSRCTALNVKNNCAAPTRQTITQLLNKQDTVTPARANSSRPSKPSKQSSLRRVESIKGCSLCYRVLQVEAVQRESHLLTSVLHIHTEPALVAFRSLFLHTLIRDSFLPHQRRLVPPIVTQLCRSCVESATTWRVVVNNPAALRPLRQKSNRTAPHPRRMSPPHPQNRKRRSQQQQWQMGNQRTPTSVDGANG